MILIDKKLWEGRYIKDRDLGNKAVYGYLYGKSYTEVKQKLEQVKSHKNDSNNLSVTFAKLSEKWLENKKLCVKASTLAHYKMIIDKHILPLLGRYDISSVNADIIQQYMNKLIIDGYATKTASDNGDGEINAKDRMMLTRYLAKWSGYESVDMTAADVNNDGDVNAKDRMILTRHLAKWQGYETLPFDKI